MNNMYYIFLRMGICCRISQVVKCVDYLNDIGDIKFVWIKDKECPVEYDEVFYSSDYSFINDPYEIPEDAKLVCIKNKNLINCKGHRLLNRLISLYQRDMKKNLDIVYVEKPEDIKKIKLGVITLDVSRICCGEWPLEDNKLAIDSYRLFDLTNSIFKPKKFILDRVDNFVSRKFYGRVLGVHIRRTDYQYPIKMSPTELFLQKINKISRHFNSIYVATDDPTEISKLKNALDIPVLAFDSKGFSRDNPEHLVDSLCEMLILSRCNFILGSAGSQFSQASGLYQGRSPYVVKKLINS